MLIFAWTGELTARERKLLEGEPWSISDITLWEIAMLAKRGRIQIDLNDPDVARALMQVHVWPITREIALASGSLDFRSDPADEIIAATSLVHSVPLLTRDQILRKSKKVPLAR